MKILPHDELGITFVELGTLLGTRAMLDLGVLQHLDIPDNVDTSAAADEIGGAHVFNMNVPCKLNKECGSIHCIGGTMAVLMGLNEENSDYYVAQGAAGARPGFLGHSENLRDLFFPPGVEYNSITPQEAVKVIDTFLTTGVVDWSSVRTPDEDDTDYSADE